MCGIFGVTGRVNAPALTLDGLRKLEYRGYDSAGLAFVDGGILRIVRAVGRVDALAAVLNGAGATSMTAVGHTRWATHGRPSEINAHPHRDQSGRIALVHNGIIENYGELRAELIAQGCHFVSETDTEAAAMLIGSLYRGDLSEAVRRAAGRIEGTFAFAAVCSEHPGLIVGARRGSPLAVGSAPDGAFVLSSDPMAFLNITRKALFLDDDQIAEIRPGSLRLLNAAGIDQPLNYQQLEWNDEDVQRGGFPHFMLKEIHEQPAVLRRLAARFVADPGGDGRAPRLNMGDAALTESEAKNISRIIIVGQGTALHAGMIGRTMIERVARIPVTYEYGSDFRYRDPVTDPSVLVIGISQSGETADTLGAIRLANELGCPTFSVVNTPGSAIARESKRALLMGAGPEIGVASTKAFTAQIASLYILAIHLGQLLGTLTADDAARRVNDLLQAPGRVEEALTLAPQMKHLAEKHKDAAHMIFLGRGTGYPLALEGALKLKEISYIHAEGCDAAEMKHGPIALIDNKMPVLFIALKGRRYDKIRGNIHEVRARGGRVMAIVSHDDAGIQELAEDVIRIRDDRGIMNSIVCSVPLQLFAYYAASVRGCDVDKPRNLAKGVTVE